MLYLIGATSEFSNDINGAVVNIRPRGDKICKFFVFKEDKSNVENLFLSGLDSRLEK